MREDRKLTSPVRVVNYLGTNHRSVRRSQVEFADGWWNHNHDGPDLRSNGTRWQPIVIQIEESRVSSFKVDGLANHVTGLVITNEVAVHKSKRDDHARRTRRQVHVDGHNCVGDA